MTGYLKAVATGAIFFAAAHGAPAQPLSDQILRDFSFREIGPALFSGRITDIELARDDADTIYVAGASGGLFRSRNNGTTWQCIFQNEGTISIGDIAIDPRSPGTIWVGTGEANNQRSCYWGDGVYKTIDGGQTWANVGLNDSHHIGRIVIDPNDSNVVYVAAAGHQYTFNPERGLYKTDDGGATWQQSLFISDAVGVIDVVIDPHDSNLLYAASYERLRRPWHFDGAGPGSAIYKSNDAGASWTKLEGGLPSGDIGRIGLCISPQEPNILYTTVSNQNSRDGEDRPTLGIRGTPVEAGYQIDEVEEGSSAAQAGLQVGDVITRIAETQITSVWALISAFSALEPGQQVEIEFMRGDIAQTVTIDVRAGGGERDVHGIPVRQIGGEIYRTEDAGTTWTKMNEQPIGGSPPYYYGQIRVDPTDSNRIYVLSVPLYASSDGGKTWEQGNVAGSLHVDHHALVIDHSDPTRLILGNDGGLGISYDRGETWDHYANIPLAQFYAVGVDMQQPYHVYGGTQDNGTWGGPSHSRSGGGITNDDWYIIGGGDGFYAQVDPTNSDIVYAEAQFGSVYRLDKSTGRSTSIRPQQRDEHPEPYRFNWNSPILISHHNPAIIYFGGNRLFKSYNRGDTWAVVSCDLTTADAEKIKGNVPHCTITTIAESLLDPNLLMVGTDDGLVQVSEDGGLSWTNLAGRFPGVPAHWWVSRVELSRHDRNVAYASFTGYREDDFRPFVYRTADLGQTWQRIAADLPNEPINVVREDPRNPNVIWIGTEFGAWVSIDRGDTWTKLRNGLPTIAVHDLVVHPRDRDLVLATHGRGFFIMDVAPIQELSPEVLGSDAHLFSIEDAYQWQFRRSRGGTQGDRHFTGRNAEYGATIPYYLRNNHQGAAIALTILNELRETVATLEPATEAGLHRLTWNLQTESRADDEGERGERRRRRRGDRTELVAPGTYTAVLKVGDNEQRQTFEVRPDPEFARD